MTPWRDAFAAVLAKDLRSELRTMRSLPAMVLFAITTFVIFGDPATRTTYRRAPVSHTSTGTVRR